MVERKWMGDSSSLREITKNCFCFYINFFFWTRWRPQGSRVRRSPASTVRARPTVPAPEARGSTAPTSCGDAVVNFGAALLSHKCII